MANPIKGITVEIGGDMPLESHCSDKQGISAPVCLFAGGYGDERKSRINKWRRFRRRLTHICPQCGQFTDVLENRRGVVSSVLPQKGVS